jgi:hypothetical protein
MTTGVKFQQFVEDLAHGVHDLETDQLVIALSNTAPSVSADAVLADVTEVSYANCSSRNITISSSAHTTGTYRLILSDLTLSASGGNVGPFQYVIVYNDTPTSPADPLIGYYDYGSAVTINDGEDFLIDFDGSNGFISLT